MLFPTLKTILRKIDGHQAIVLMRTVNKFEENGIFGNFAQQQFKATERRDFFGIPVRCLSVQNCALRRLCYFQHADR
jgi:hypothetical protein